MKNNLIERVFKRLLLESTQFGDMAVIVKYDDDNNRRIATVYDPAILKDNLREDNSEDRISNAAWEAVKGHIAISKPARPCSGAWSVDEVWGPGRGSIVYGLGYVLSPMGLLMPDRRGSLSGKARRAWQGAIHSGFLNKIELDDCDLLGMAPELDFAYGAGDREQEYLNHYNAMREKHEETIMELLDEYLGISRDEIEEKIRRSGSLSFGQRRS